MNSYHAPYKAKHRYWPGLLLILCFDLFLTYALNPQQDPNTNLLAILVGTVAFTTFLGILAFHLADVTGIVQYLNREYRALRRSIRLMRRHVHQVEEEEEYDIDTLPDRKSN